MEAAEKASWTWQICRFGKRGKSMQIIYDAICLLFCILFIFPVLGELGCEGLWTFSVFPAANTTYML